MDEAREALQLTDDPRVASGELGNPPVPSESPRQAVIGEYDKNKNALVDTGELAGFLQRRSGRAQDLILDITGPMLLEEPFAAPLWRWLDMDADERLSDDELSAASDRLRRLDANDDQTLVRPPRWSPD